MTPRERGSFPARLGRGFLVGLLSVALVLVLACGSGDSGSASPHAVPGQSASATPLLPDRSPTQLELPIQIAVTLPLFKEFAGEAGGENAHVISLLPDGADPHSYMFTNADIEKTMGINFFFLNGLGLDTRLQQVIEANRDDNAHVIPFAPNILSPRRNGQTAEEAGDDPHLWLDPSLAYVYVEIVADELDIYDGIRKSSYDANFSSFKLRMLDFQNEIFAQIQAVPAERRKIISYHNAFDHFARRFDLSIAGYAVDEPGAMPDRDAIAALARTVREQSVSAVFAEFGYDRTVMDQIGAQAGVPVCTLYSDISDPTLTYEAMMRANANEIVRCLGGGEGG